MKKLWWVRATRSMEFLAWGKDKREAEYEFDSYEGEHWDVDAEEIALKDVPSRNINDQPWGDPDDDEATDMSVREVLDLLRERREAEPIKDTQTAPLPFPEAKP